MSTTTQLNVPLSRPLGGVSLLAVQVKDYDTSVDVTPSGANFAGLPAGTWKCNIHISSTPAVGAGASYLYTVTSAANATTLAVAPTTAYHALKDFEGGTARTIYVTVEVFDGSSRVAYGTASMTVTAAAAARTDQAYSLQIPWLLVSASNGALGGTGYTSWHSYIDAVADVLQPVAGHPERTVIRTGVHWGFIATAAGVYDAGVQAWYDDIFSYANGKGLGIMADIGMVTPSWARTAPPWGTTGYTNVAGNAVTYCSGAPAPTAWSSWTDFVNWFVGRYCTRGLTHVQCGNEPNAQRASSWRDTDAVYAVSHNYLGQQVKATVAATVGAFPVKVGLPNLALGDLAYLQSIASNGLAGANFDAISWHPYSLSIPASGGRESKFSLDRRIPVQDGMSTVLKHTDTVGGGDAFMDQALATFPGKAFWLAETGFSYGVRQAGEPSYDIPEAQGADQWRYTLRQAARMPRVDLVDVWGLWDFSPSLNAEITNYGLLRHDGSKRPAYAAVKQAIADIRAGVG